MDEREASLSVDLPDRGGVEMVVGSFPVAGEAQLPPRSRAERRVVLMALRGMSSSALADERATSVRAVANQLASSFRGRGVSARAEPAAALADLPG